MISVKRFATERAVDFITILDNVSGTTSLSESTKVL